MCVYQNLRAKMATYHVTQRGIANKIRLQDSSKVHKRFFIICKFPRICWHSRPKQIIVTIYVCRRFWGPAGPTKMSHGKLRPDVCRCERAKTNEYPITNDKAFNSPLSLNINSVEACFLFFVAGYNLCGSKSYRVHRSAELISYSALVLRKWKCKSPLFAVEACRNGHTHNDKEIGVK